MRELWTAGLGLVPYSDALDLQRAVARARIAGIVAQDVLLLVQHPPVVTLGRTAKAGHVTAAPELLRARGVEMFEIERGGDVTFHGPGQLVGYPIVNLDRHRRDLHWYLRQVEEALVRGLAALGVAAERNPGLTGVWTRGRKLASIGVHAREWVTWHGFALNVSTDLSFFDLIVPCGIDGVVMTSLERELGSAPEMPAVEAVIADAFADVFALEAVPVTADAPRALVAAEATGVPLGVTH